MATAESFRLKWNDWQACLSGSFATLRDLDELCDVKLVTEDYEEVRAHKVLLSACSPFFNELFKRQTSPDLVLYLKGVSNPSLVSILEFVYTGEVNVGHESINGFLLAAQELSIRGLTSDAEVNEKVKEKAVKRSKVGKSDQNQTKKQKLAKKDESDENNDERLRDLQFVQEMVTGEDIDAENNGETIEMKNEETVPEHNEPLTKSSNGTLETVPVTEEMSNAILADIDSYMIQPEPNVYACSICGKKSHLIRSIRRHLEYVHTNKSDNVPCPGCGKIFKRKQTLVEHMKSNCHAPVRNENGTE